nr:unnamed protein product [Callosobruchus analis]
MISTVFGVALEITLKLQHEDMLRSSASTEDHFNGFRKLFEQCKQIIILWTPGHTGIRGNELADEAARQATESTITDIPLSLDDAKAALKNPKSIKSRNNKVQGKPTIWGMASDGEEAACDCGALQDTGHLIQCPNVGEACTRADLILANDKATAVADFWKFTIGSGHVKDEGIKEKTLILINASFFSAASGKDSISPLAVIGFKKHVRLLFLQLER